MASVESRVPAKFGRDCEEEHKVKPYLLALAVFAASASLSMRAQEQTFLINGPQGVLSNPPQYVDVNAATMDPANAASLIDATLGSGVRRVKNFYCIIHILRWSNDGKVDKQNWYLYSEKEAWLDQRFEGLRIFGTHSVALLYVHLNARSAEFADLERVSGNRDVLEALFRQQGARLEEQKKRLLQVELANLRSPLPDLAGFRERAISGVKDSKDSEVDKIAEAQGWKGLSEEDLEARYVAANSDRAAAAAQRSRLTLRALNAGENCGFKVGDQDLVRAGSSPACVPQSYAAASYRVEVTKKLPSQIQDLFELLSPHGLAKARDVPLEPVALWGGRSMGIASVPSDVKVTPSVTTGGKTTALESRTYDNEGRYYWDISAAVPLRSIKETTYDSSAGSFTPKNVDRQTLYAVFNVFPFAVDTKGTNYRWFTPALLVGLGITDKPLDRLLFAGAIGLNKVQFFWGCSVTRKQFPGPAGNPQAITFAYRSHSIFGLNVPIRQVLKTLKAAK